MSAMEALQANREGETPHEARQTTTAGGERELTKRVHFPPYERFTQPPLSTGLPLETARTADRTARADGMDGQRRRSSSPTRRSRRRKHVPWPVA